jgi:transposase
MAMGKRRAQQAGMWVATADLPAGPGHPFYRRLNEILDGAGFDGYVEVLCQRFYARGLGRPSLSPGRYFRLLLLGYFEGLDSERGIAWRAADSLGVRNFLGLSLDEAAPDHSTISRTRRRIDEDAHCAVFTWVQERLVDADLLRGKTIGIDATTLEANAAMRSIRRRDSGASYEKYLKDLAEASGIKTPTREALARLDRRRKKKTSNKDWTSPSDPDAKIARMKDGRTHLAHKAEHAIDTDTGAIVAVTIQGADRGDQRTLPETLSRAERQIDRLLANPRLGDGTHCQGLREVIADKGYHCTAVLADIEERGLRAYISEPKRPRRQWRGNRAAQMTVYANRRRMRGARGKRLARLRGEMVERPFAHLYETGAMRRTHLRGHANIYKRLLVHAGGFNLGLLMRALVGIGKPRRLQGRLSALLARLVRLVDAFLGQLLRRARAVDPATYLHPSQLLHGRAPHSPRSAPSTTGC